MSLNRKPDFGIRPLPFLCYFRRLHFWTSNRPKRPLKHLTLNMGVKIKISWHTIEY